MNQIEQLMALADEYVCESELYGQRSVFAEQVRRALRTAIEQALTPGEPEGWKLVPVEPTVEMLDAGGRAVRACYSNNWDDRRKGEVMCGYVYRKMLAAAPQPQPKQEPEISSITADPHKANKAFLGSLDNGNFEKETGISVYRLGTEQVPQPQPKQEPVMRWCETCSGTGRVYQEHQAGCWVGGKHDCPDCEGHGYTLTQPQPKQEPVAKVCHDLEGHIGWNPNLTELPNEGAELYTAPQPQPYDQQALELCEVCGWKTLIPGDGCLNCERKPQLQPDHIPDAGKMIDDTALLRQALEALENEKRPWEQPQRDAAIAALRERLK